MQAATNVQVIEFGQICELTKEGEMDPAATSPAPVPGTFQVQNNYGSIHLGVNALLNGDLSPVYVSPEVATGTATFTPISSVMVWFSTDDKSSTMLFNDSQSGIEVVYEGTTDKAIEYAGPKGNGTWSLVD